MNKKVLAIVSHPDDAEFYVQARLPYFIKKAGKSISQP